MTPAETPAPAPAADNGSPEVVAIDPAVLRLAERLSAYTDATLEASQATAKGLRELIAAAKGLITVKGWDEPTARAQFSAAQIASKVVDRICRTTFKVVKAAVTMPEEWENDETVKGALGTLEDACAMLLLPSEKTAAVRWLVNRLLPKK